MLMQRVVTALVLLPILLAAVWFLPTPALYVLLCAAGLGVAWEWSALMGLKTRGPRLAYVALSGALLALTWCLREFWPWFSVASLVWWALAFVLLLGYPANFQRRKPGLLQMGVIGQVLLLPTLLSLAILHGMEQGVLRLLYVFFLIFAADTGAYIAGRSLGRHKLAPAVSPGKTVEGALGGLLLCGAWALTGGVYAFGAGGNQVWLLLALSLAVAALSIVGDLTESLFKRAAGVKDSGNILPGHGGILDRVDSLLAAAPAMALGVYLIGL